MSIDININAKVNFNLKANVIVNGIKYNTRTVNVIGNLLKKYQQQGVLTSELVNYISSNSWFPKD